jgi:hypothetical protein
MTTPPCFGSRDVGVDLIRRDGAGPVFDLDHHAADMATSVARSARGDGRRLHVFTVR